MNCHVNTKVIVVTASAIGGATLIGIVAALAYNSKKMRTLRAVKRASRVMYHVGTAMRNISGEADNV
ncbi:MAG: hypothetical protein IJW49_03125 [Clostridia bacterium]|nr:hypothetical protein [Clostridia bacterium]